jgi:hypothetical protein
MLRFSPMPTASRPTRHPIRLSQRATARTLAGCLCLTLLATDAAAYIDPGYGALLQQLVLSGVFGALFLARRTLIGIARRVARLCGGAPVATAAGEAPQPAAPQERQKSNLR